MSVAAIEELVEDFVDLDQHEACQYLDELGRELPEIPEHVYDNSNLVAGCQSRVWMVCRFAGGAEPRLEIQADSDAIIVKGLISVLLKMYVGLGPREVSQLDHERVFEQLGLGRLITPQRKNGLFGMVKRIRETATAALGLESTSETLPRTENRVSPATPTPRRPIEDIAREFPILVAPLPSGKRPVFLDSGASAQKPAVVIEKEREVEEQYFANAFRGRYYFGQRVDDEIEATRRKAAELIGARSAAEIVFTSGTTMSLNMIAHGLGKALLEPGSEVLITEMEHHANFVPWQRVTEQAGAALRILPVGTDGLLDFGAVESMIGPQTKIVAFCSMSNVLGTINPTRELCRRARAVGAVTVVDAAQSVPHLPTDVVADAIDFLTFSGHKLYGPTGVGVLYGRYDWLERLDPMVFGGHMIERVGRERSTWAAPPAKFEAGTPPIVQIIGLGAAIDFVHSIGWPAIEQLDAALVSHAHRRLDAIDGLTIHGPAPDRKGAIVSFSIDGVAAEDLAFRLDHQGIFTRHGHHCAMVLHERLGVPATTRASFGIYNTVADVDALADAVDRAVREIRR